MGDVCELLRLGQRSGGGELDEWIRRVKSEEGSNQSVPRPMRPIMQPSQVFNLVFTEGVAPSVEYF